MESTPGARHLPKVKDETSSVVEALGTSVHVEILDQPDAASVMRQIHQCNIAHFACHGISDSTDPSQSGLVLQSTGANPRQDILTVRSVYENQQSLGVIAYLSACSTAENRVNKLVDEVLHVVSGFQVAGFRHVVGSLWPSDDNVCLEVARSFYTELCRNGTLNYTDRDVAMALHTAVSEVSTSEEYRRRPLLWAQYVHYGT
jgi:CHAT domain-containing protein